MYTDLAYIAVDESVDQPLSCPNTIQRFQRKDNKCRSKIMVYTFAWVDKWLTIILQSRHDISIMCMSSDVKLLLVLLHSEIKVHPSKKWLMVKPWWRWIDICKIAIVPSVICASWTCI